MTDSDTTNSNVINAKCKWILEKSLLQINKERWAARRHMAWLSLLCIIVFTLIFIFLIPVPSLVALAPVISWLYLSMTSIVGIFAGAEVLSYMSSVKAGTAMSDGWVNDPSDPESKLLNFGVNRKIKTPFDDLTHQPGTSNN